MLSLMLIVLAILAALALAVVWCAGAAAKAADEQMEDYARARCARRAPALVLCNPGDEDMKRQLQQMRDDAVQMGAVA